MYEEIIRECESIANLLEIESVGAMITAGFTCNCARFSIKRFETIELSMCGALPLIKKID